MLRIERSVHGDGVRLTLSGRMEAEHVAELRRLIEDGTQPVLALDLRELKLVDGDAVRFLARCEAGGVTLEHCCAYVREWIVRESEARGPKRPRRR